MDSDTLRARELTFCPLHPDADQAHTAAQLLAALPGVLAAEAQAPTQLAIRYDLRAICLLDLEHVLDDAGLHLDNSLLQRLKRALIHYTEETLRANLASDEDPTRQVFVHRYRRLRHGCRDRRPDHWRHYL
ncbi:hypothetical protein HUS23_03070 [Ectothiorhodospiraceae bacterium 2226]|nr:hypothetical protein HUS23_03070 [Ectothiorhodospiraceae bacterium 2226]